MTFRAVSFGGHHLPSRPDYVFRVIHFYRYDAKVVQVKASSISAHMVNHHAIGNLSKLPFPKKTVSDERPASVSTVNVFFRIPGNFHARTGQTFDFAFRINQRKDRLRAIFPFLSDRPVDGAGNLPVPVTLA